MRPIKVILDANTLIEAAKNKADIFGQINDRFAKPDIVTSASVMAELKKISGGKGSNSIAARVAIQLAKKNSVGARKTKDKGDDSLLELCDGDSILITQDRNLRERCKRLGFSTGFIREKRYLTFEREIR
ncbi:MAG: hypothetical protein HY051_03175 [Candidatus Aenigmarchaeota archaeon]|nr:hypothetical protein [Candidatus Aenigmarchaeota archaeon]